MDKDLEKLELDIIAAGDVAKRKKEVDLKSLTLREHKVTVDLEQFQKNQKELEQAKSVKFGEMTDEAIQKLVDDNAEYMEAAQHSMSFIHDGFKGVVPYFRKNLILLGGDTGDGKSTTVANIVYRTIAQKNPMTGKSCRILVLTNEEAAEDFYNRVTCLMHGWKYTNHDLFTDQQRKTMAEFIPKLAKGGRLTIIGDVYQGVPGWTTTVEGIRDIFNNILRDGNTYDAILIDYYQNIRFSKTNPKLDEFACQREVSAVLDQVKMRFPAPIILMAQMKKLAGEDDQTPFNVRLKGSKIICDKATFIGELIPQRKLFRSLWKVWKSRFTDAVGEQIITGYDRGKFVPYDDAFQRSVAHLIDSELLEKMQEELGMDIKEKQDESKN